LAQATTAQHCLFSLHRLQILKRHRILHDVCSVVYSMTSCSLVAVPADVINEPGLARPRTIYIVPLTATLTNHRTTRGGCRGRCMQTSPPWSWRKSKFSRHNLCSSLQVSM